MTGLLLLLHATEYPGKALRRLLYSETVFLNAENKSREKAQLAHANNALTLKRPDNLQL